VILRGRPPFVFRGQFPGVVAQLRGQGAAFFVEGLDLPAELRSLRSGGRRFRPGAHRTQVTKKKTDQAPEEQSRHCPPVMLIHGCHL
jgi:hypothetical protein